MSQFVMWLSCDLFQGRQWRKNKRKGESAASKSLSDFDKSVYFVKQRRTLCFDCIASFFIKKQPLFSFKLVTNMILRYI